VGFEPTIPVFEQAKTVRALDRAATVNGITTTTTTTPTTTTTNTTTTTAAAAAAAAANYNINFISNYCSHHF
jgi:uncharacterized protein (DUF305 family)